MTWVLACFDSRWPVWNLWVACFVGEPTQDKWVSEQAGTRWWCMDETQATVSKPARHSKRRTVDTPALALKLHQYYQLECMRPTPARLQIWLDEFLRKADAAIDHRAQSAGDH